MVKYIMCQQNVINLREIGNTMKIKMFLYTIAFLISFIIESQGSTVQPRVKRCLDGDTIELTDGVKVRILGIDAYDSRSSKMIDKQTKLTGKSRDDIRSLAKLGKLFCEDNLINAQIRLASDMYSRDIDIYGRQLSYILINKDGYFIDYSEIIIRQGLANVYCGNKKILNYKRYNELSEYKCD